MTALAQPRIDRHDPLAALRRRRSERGLFAIALGAALALHLAALLLPLPSRPAASPPPPEPKPDRHVYDLPLPPPDIPEPPPPAAAPSERPIPLPMPDAPPAEPVVEPRPPRAPEPGLDGLPDFAQFAPSPPPPGMSIMEEGAPGLTPPRLISKCADPEYPAMAVRVGFEGAVVLRALITEEGDVTSIELIRAPRPDFGFSESAISAVSCWKYEPGRYRGRAVAVSLTVFVEFELD